MFGRGAVRDFGTDRQRMVLDQLERRGIADARVLEAMRRIPREEFVPEARRRWAYADEPLPIGFGQTISQPYIAAVMAEALEVEPGGRALEVGTGSGYAAALLAELGARVITIERIEGLAEAARTNLSRAGYADRVLVVCGDGSLGWTAGQPYEIISVAAAAPEVPLALCDQLAENGRLVIPIGSLDEHDLLLYHKLPEGMQVRSVTRCRFVPLLGVQGWRLQ